MRARTLTIGAFFFFLALIPARASAASSIIAQMDPGMGPPYARLGAPLIVLDHPDVFVATGTLSDIVITIQSDAWLDGTGTLYAGIFDARNDKYLDCHTPTKTTIEWGVPQEPFVSMSDIPKIDLGPFTGSECDLWNHSSYPYTELQMRLYYGDYDQHLYNNGLAFGVDSEGHIPFIAYAGGLPAATTSPTASSVLFLPGAEASRLYIREGSGERQLWEPSFHTDIPFLAMDANGKSVHTVYTKDIIGSLYDNDTAIEGPLARLMMPDDLEVYHTFSTFMSGMVAAGTIKEWRAYPYDWRYDPFDIVESGTLTEQSDGSLQTTYVQDVLREMASSSPTGKVTIVAHSYGGLVAKALAITLGPDAPAYIDRVIMVGTPQLGTPKTIGAMLHGDDHDYGFAGINFIMSGIDVRAASRNMPGVYDLLPSSGYFGMVNDKPVATFDAVSGPPASSYASTYGASIASKSGLDDLLTDPSGLDATTGVPGDPQVPLALSPTLLTKAADTHAKLDAWLPPAGITATTIAGWGQSTPLGLAYGNSFALVCTRQSLFSLPDCQFTIELEHTKMMTQDGDGSVIDASAVSGTVNPLFFNTEGFRQDTKQNIVHRNLLTSDPVEAAIKDLLQNRSALGEPYLSADPPPGGSNPLSFLTVVSNSPLDVTDLFGGDTGVVDIPGTDFSIKKEHASGTSVSVDGSGNESITVPNTGEYKVTVGGTSTSTSSKSKKSSTPSKTKVKVKETKADGTATTTAEFEVPTTASTTITFTINNGVPGVPVVDPGDGTPWFYFDPEQGPPPPETAIQVLREQFQALGTRPGVKNRLLRALQPIEDAGGNMASVQDAVTNLEKLVKAQMGVQLSLEQGAAMLQLLATLKL